MRCCRGQPSCGLSGLAVPPQCSFLPLLPLLLLLCPLLPFLLLPFLSAAALPPAPPPPLPPRTPFRCPSAPRPQHSGSRAGRETPRSPRPWAGGSGAPSADPPVPCPSRPAKIPLPGLAGCERAAQCRLGWDHIQGTRDERTSYRYANYQHSPSEDNVDQGPNLKETGRVFHRKLVSPSSGRNWERR
nr:WAS/WASL-interacting protein family member 3-like [Taeniopygia guttata]